MKIVSISAALSTCRKQRFPKAIRDPVQFLRACDLVDRAANWQMQSVAHGQGFYVLETFR